MIHQAVIPMLTPPPEMNSVSSSCISEGKHIVDVIEFKKVKSVFKL